MNWVQWRNREHKDQYATVTRDGFTVPLIGVPDTATKDECQRCGKISLFSEMKFSKDGELLCPQCRVLLEEVYRLRKQISAYRWTAKPKGR